MVCGPYDRARALIDGTVKPEGIELDITVNAKDPGSPLQLERAPFDAVEFYTGAYIADLPYRALGYTAIPIFVKRMFRHSYIYVNASAGIRTPSQLNGRRVGLFPIMHTLLVKNAVLEREPWVAMSLYNAWMDSKRACYQRLEWERIHLTSLWYRALREEELAAGGEDFYRWGFAKSRAEVD